MTTRSRTAVVLIPALAFALTACDGGDEQVTTFGSPPSAQPSAAASPRPLAALPQGMIGRWGVQPSDCRGGAGLMTVAATQLTFPTSRAAVSDIVEVRPGTVTAELTYRNRDGSWRSPTSITLRPGGRAMQRLDTHPSGLFNYTRC